METATESHNCQNSENNWCWVPIPSCYIFNILPIQRAQGGLWKRGWEDCRSQRTRISYMRQCLRQQTGKLHPWNLSNTDILAGVRWITMPFLFISICSFEIFLYEYDFYIIPPSHFCKPYYVPFILIPKFIASYFLIYYIHVYICICVIYASHTDIIFIKLRVYLGS